MAVFETSRRHIFPSKSTLLLYKFWTLFILFITVLNQSDAWDNTDLELFDLVEEVSQNFYEVLGLDQSANQGDIRRAYRRLSLQYHPDKNKEEDAEETFRQLVAVAEVLRDEDKRRRYDDILLNGLPDWRQPVYYYRRVRKMGLLEATTLLSIILTVGHYIVIWSMYWERKFELESLIKPKREKKNKKLTKSSDEQKPDAYAILEDPTFLPKPQITDCLPFKCYRLSKASIFFMIACFRSFFTSLHQKFEKKSEEPIVASDEEEEEEEVERKPRERQKINPAFYDYNRDVSVEHLTAMREALLKEEDKPEDETKNITKNVIWTQAEVKLLIKSIAKYPGGTIDRWEKIAAEIGRPLNEVTKKAKEIKNKGYATAVDASIQGITGSENHTVVNKTTGEVDADTISIASSPLEDQPITCEVASYDYFDDEEMSKKKRRHKGGKSSKSSDRTEMIFGQNDQERTVKSLNSEMDSGNKLASVVKSSDEPRGVGEGVGGIGVGAHTDRTKPEAVEDILFDGVESCSWTQRQQKILEKALQVYPKGTPERWDRIAGTVPGKNKEECILRYKELVEIVRRKKMAADK